MLNLPFLKGSKNTILLNGKTNYIALDIGTETLKSVLFTMDDLGVKVEKISRIQQQRHAMRSGIITNLDTVLENCRLSMEELCSNLLPEDMPRNVIMGIAGEYIQGVSIIVNYQREDNYAKEVTVKEQSQIINRIKNQIENNGKKDLSQRTGLQTEDIEILHITPTGLEIGGMPVNSLVNYRGKDVRLHFYASFAPKTYVEALKKVAQDLNLEIMGVVAQPFAVARAFAGSSNDDFSGIFIDIGGGTTDVAIVERGNVVETQMFAFGGRVFTKEIAQTLDIDFRHAEMRKIKYSNKDLSKDISRKVKSITYPTARLWMKTLQAALECCDDVDNFPTQIYLCGGGALLPDIKDVLLEFPWKRYLPFSVVPKVNFFTPDMLELIIDNSGDLRNIFDITPVSLAKFAYTKEIEKQTLNINI